MRKNIKLVLVFNLLFFGFLGATSNALAATDKGVEVDKLATEEENNNFNDQNVEPQAAQSFPAIFKGVIIGNYNS